MTSTRALLVTGASSGIGRHLAETLAGLGHRVHATARRDEDLESLSGIAGVNPIRLDVKSAAEVEAARAAIAAEGRGLAGLVNNAGVGALGPLASFTDEDFREQFEVNVFGPHRLTNAVMPLLVESGGRVINIGSQGGMITGRYYGAYCMTKHALEAYSTALSEELAPHGVGVSIVQPGGVVSEIGRKSQPGITSRLGNAPPPFEAECRDMLEALRFPADAEPDTDAPESAENRKPSPPDIVTEAVLDALFSDAPKPRYLVGTRWEGDRIVSGLLERLVQANDSPSLGYTRDELVARLDAALAGPETTES